MNRFLYFTNEEDKQKNSLSIKKNKGAAVKKLKSFIFTKTMLKENIFLDSMEHEEDNSIKSKIMTAILTNNYAR